MDGVLFEEWVREMDKELEKEIKNLRSVRPDLISKNI